MKRNPKTKQWLLVSCLLCASVLSVKAQSVSLQVNEMRFEQILSEIRTQTGYSFVYSDQIVDVNQRVSVQVQDMPLTDALKQVLKGTNLKAEIRNKQIFLIEKERRKELVLPNKMVEGVITDANGEFIIGANITVKGSADMGTVTDVDGKFSLEVPEDAKLIISYIGFANKEVDVKGKSQFNILMKEDSELLDEVVVVGYGVQKKVNLTGSVSEIDGKEMSMRPVTDATQSLQGIVPGLTVSNNNSGRPGASGTISLRGQGNLTNTANPYILVDGVEMSLADVNPSDIETISVLKDAAAAAIYGARAAYGVILVTTKKGEEGKMRVGYQGTIGWSSPTSLPKMVNAFEFATYFNEATKNAGVNQQYSEEKLALLKQYMKDPTGINPWSELTSNNLVAAFENTAKGVGNVDYFKLHYKNMAFKQNHNISLSGGGKQAQYYVSSGFYSEDGIMRFADMKYKRYNFNGSLSSNLTKWLKLKANTKFMHSDEDTPFGNGGLGEGFYHSLARFRPTVNEIDPNGNYTELTMIPYLQSGTYTNDKKYNLSLTGGFEIQPLKDWFIFTDYTFRMNNNQYEALNVAPMILGADGKTLYKATRGELGIAPNGKFTRIESASNYQSINMYTNYLFSVNSEHNFTLMGGYQEEKYDYRYLNNSTTDLISTNNPGLSLGTGNQTIIDTRNGWATRGFFGRINYDFMGKYLLEINARYDGSSRFSKDNRWGLFPSVAAGWNIAYESFMQSIRNTLSSLKLRVSYGLLGNQNGAAMYTFASVMNTSSLGRYYFADGREMYINGPGVVVPNTTWEKVESKNIGIDFGLFENKLSGTFEVFQRDTKDMLGPTADFADMFGANSPNTNNARMQNRGWELLLQYKGNINEAISYTIGGTLSDATSKVTSYENPTGTSPMFNWYVGKHVGEIWGYRASGLIQNQDEADTYNKTYDLSYISGQNWTPGDVKYIDLNGDGKINNGTNTLENMGDQVVIGNTTPRYQYSINGSMEWKGLSLSIILQGVAKRDWTPGKGTVYFWGAGPYAQVTVFKEHLDYWTEDNKNAYYPKPYTAGAGAINKFRNKTSQISDRYLQNAAYCRLKNITLSYNIPEIWSKKIGLSKTQIFFSGENLFTFTKLPKQFDPETIFTGNSYTNESGKNYPMNRIISVGLIINL